MEIYFVLNGKQNRRQTSANYSIYLNECNGSDIDICGIPLMLGQLCAYD